METGLIPSSTQFGAGGSQVPSRLGTPTRKEIHPGFWEKFKGPQEGPSEDFNFDLLKEAVSQIAMRGSLTDYMEVVMQDYPDMQKSWRSKARFLLDVYKEPDAKTAKLMAATFFFASRINYISTGCEYMATQYCAEVRAELRKFGKSESWSKDTVLEIESMIREKYFNFKAMAEKELSRGNVKPINGWGDARMLVETDARDKETPSNSNAFQGSQNGSSKTEVAKPEKTRQAKECTRSGPLAEPRFDPAAMREDFNHAEEDSPDGALSERQIEDVDCEADPLMADSATERDESTLSELCTFEEVAAIPVRAPFDYDLECLKDGVRRVLGELEEFRDGRLEVNEEEDRAWLQNVEKNVLNPDQFRAGNFNRTIPAWEELLKDSKRKTSKMVLGALKEGLKPSFEGTDNALESKRKVVKAMLLKTVPKREVSSFLTGKFPSEIEFSNHQSAEDNADFVWNEVKSNLASGAISAYPKGSKPKVVNPIGVVFNPKPRRILNARYINLFMKSLPKCLLEPAQSADWLGFVVDSLLEIFRISEKKKLKVFAVLEQILESDEITARMLASMAGKLVSLGPAMLPASLFSRPLFAAMQGKLT
ncbi:hypothetical protein KFL_008780040 [Klebsormidium nitens]|uniref:Uncharacterized protein n=1 Tax=Klebsormidium nitens TaxID=105231 RepID=A0A1Y1IRM7_KLENI|nr:hypothetical protein KFL_008780040 [Klebsormidium nitens]|eukprot:GAQ91901.1 hypothetical protein KFL_008780040 [Klebsormidium nitens]